VFTNGERKTTDEWLKIIKRYRRDLKNRENLSDEIFPTELKPRPNSRKKKASHQSKKTKPPIRKALRTNSKKRQNSRKKKQKSPNPTSNDSLLESLLKMLGLK
jgi:chromatin segregation and condensation protein Rec8/ScpA/Scc1 (kleisin family)